MYGTFSATTVKLLETGMDPAGHVEPAGWLMIAVLLAPVLAALATSQTCTEPAAMLSTRAKGRSAGSAGAAGQEICRLTVRAAAAL
jgi:hypothetical protein